jgi:lipid kinase, YegS/Rv2252/BmrU family
MGKKLLFVFNQKSGRARIKNYISDILNLFTGLGYEIEVHVTQKQGDAADIVMRRGKSKQVIVCSGGDGTLNEVVTGLMKLENKPEIVYIPSGSTNDFATSLKLPKNMLEAAGLIDKGSVYACDIGKFDNKYFAYVAAFGLFTDVPYMTMQQTKNILGHQAYIFEAIKRLAKIKPYHMKFEYDDKVIEDDFLYGMISNTTSVGGFKNIISDNICMNDGLFEVALIKMPTKPSELADIIQGLILKGNSSEYIKRFKVSNMHITTESNIDWVLDGEYGGNTNDFYVSAIKEAINIKIPAMNNLSIIDK